MNEPIFKDKTYVKKGPTPENGKIVFITQADGLFVRGFMSTLDSSSKSPFRMKIVNFIKKYTEVIA